MIFFYNIEKFSLEQIIKNSICDFFLHIIEYIYFGFTVLMWLNLYVIPCERIRIDPNTILMDVMENYLQIAYHHHHSINLIWVNNALVLLFEPI